MHVQLAALCDIRDEQLARLWKLERDMSVGQLAAIADGLGVDPEDLVMSAREWRSKLAHTNEILSAATELTAAQKRQIRDEVTRTGMSGTRMAPSQRRDSV